MLVLVINFRLKFLIPTTRGLATSLAIALMIPTLCMARDTENKDPFGEHSVLERSGQVETASANVAVSINDNPAQSVANPLPIAPSFPDDPVPPKGMLIPSSPSPATFTQSDIATNGLRSVSVVGADSLNPDRSGAQGTFATTNQSMQNPPIVASQGISQFKKPGQFTSPDRSFTPPPSTRGSFETPVVSSIGDMRNSKQAPIVSSIGDMRSSNQRLSDSSKSAGSVGASQSRSTVSPRPRTSNWQTDTNQSPNSGSPRVASAPVGQFSGATNSQRSMQSYNANANSNYNRGINQNIASGPPSIQSRNGNMGISNRTQQQAPIRNPSTSFNRDSSVRPSGFAQPVSSAPRRKINTGLAKNLIARYSTDGMDRSQLPGRPVKLVDMLKQPIASDQRRPLVHQFWETYFDWASLVNSQEYLRHLEGLSVSGNSAEQALLQTAKMVARNNVLASEIQLVKSQSKLNQFIPNRQPNQPLLVPNDQPLIGGYKTNYEQYKAVQAMPTSLLGIDKMLPKTLELILQRADTVGQAQQTNQQMVSGLRNRQVSLVDALDAAKQLREVEQSLLVAVTDYNHAITDYFLTVAKSYGYIPPEQVVAKLIGAPKSSAPTVSNPNPNLNEVAQRFKNTRNNTGSSIGLGTQGQTTQGNFGQNNRRNSFDQNRNMQTAQPRTNGANLANGQFGTTGNTARTAANVGNESRIGQAGVGQSNTGQNSRSIPVGRITPLVTEQNTFGRSTQQRGFQAGQQPVGNTGNVRNAKQFNLSTQGQFNANPVGGPPAGNRGVAPASPVNQGGPSTQGNLVPPSRSNTGSGGIFEPLNTNPLPGDRSARAPNTFAPPTGR